MLAATSRPLRPTTYKAKLEAVAGAWASLRSPVHCLNSSGDPAYHASSRRAKSWARISGSSPANQCTHRDLLGISDAAGTRRTVTAMSTASTAAATDALAADGGVLASDLWADIVRVYERAEATGACSKTETQVELCFDAAMGVEFVLRVASALKAKPQGPQAAEQRSTPPQGQAADGPAPPPPSAPPAAPPPPPAWRNPFLPPDPDLFVRHLGPAHSLVLNKFNVVPYHSIVITREFRSQAEPLYGDDLAAALNVVQAMPQGGLAFYNCGPYSGRSQPHKHLQVVPLPFADGQPPRAPVQTLVEAAAEAAAAAPGGRAAPLQPLELRQVPYRCYATLLPASPSPQELEAAFNSLLQLAFPGCTYEPPAVLQHGPPTDAASAAAAAAGSVSYNVLLTSGWLMLVPRRAERCGPLAPNSLAFAGTMLVRSVDELDFVRQTTPSGVLAQVGEPWRGGL